MSTSVLVINVAKAQKSPEGEHLVKTHRHGTFSVSESCAGLAALKPGVLAILHIDVENIRTWPFLEQRFTVLSIKPNPTPKEVYQAIKYA